MSGRQLLGQIGGLLQWRVLAGNGPPDVRCREGQADLSGVMSTNGEGAKDRVRPVAALDKCRQNRVKNSGEQS